MSAEEVCDCRADPMAITRSKKKTRPFTKNPLVAGYWFGGRFPYD
jgi:hypothetical protein